MLTVFAPSFDIWDEGNVKPGRQSSILPLMRQTKPVIVITGAYFGKHDSLTFAGKGVDTRTGRILFAFDSVSAKDLGDAVERVRQSVMSGIATNVDPALAVWAGNQGKPPVKFTAYREFADGMVAFVNGNTRKVNDSDASGFDSARAHLANAFRLDSTYATAALWWFWSRHNAGDRRGADSVLALLAPRTNGMTPYERTLYRYEVALMHGTPEERFRLDSALVRFAPASEFLYCLGRDAIQAGHPSDALHVLESLDATYAWMKFMAPDPGFRVRALVQLARYERAIAAARQTHTTSPRDLTSIFPEIDALAALGRIDEIEGAVAQAVTRTDSLDPRLPNLMLYAGLRLEAAGRSQAARQLFARALNLYTQRPVSDQMVFGRGRSLYYLDRWDEARNAFAQLVQPSSVTTPYDFRAAMFLGSIAARQGDTSEVERIR
jgi:tetratricopeptide (TPR) repeat protein